MQLALTLILFLFCLGVIYGAICDLTSFTIPNRVSYGLAALFVPYAAIGWSELPVLQHVLLGIVVFIILMVVWRLRWIGGGDVKFLAAISLWMGPSGLLPFMLLLTVLSAAFILVLRLARQRNDLVQASNWPAMLKLVVQKAEKNVIPYGFPAGLSALAVVITRSLQVV
jgi:prepilin peptidase CpaA